MCVYDVACGVTKDKESVTYLKSTNYTEPWKNVLYSPGNKLMEAQSGYNHYHPVHRSKKRGVEK
jgi:hypothetical protein